VTAGALRSALWLGLSIFMLSGCGGQTGGAPAAGSTPSTSATPSPTAAPSPSAAPVVLAQNVGAMGTLIVAASNGHTLYTFNNDSPGVSRCSGGCASAWPPLTIAAGQMPTGGPGVTGQLATISRSDGSTQVTYKGLPLYFFHSDTKPGDTNGNYTGWRLVRP
jgi:predicted lipoprotein with Yx(FWY)xxD motif